MVSYLFGLESMAYLTCGLVDQGVEDYSLESAICKVSGTEFLWYAANRALQLRGGEGYMKTGSLREDHARHPDLPDLRGRQRRDAGLHRALGDEAGRRAALRARRDRPQRSDPLDRPTRRLRRRAGSSARSARSGSRWPIRSCRHHADAVGDQVKELAAATEALIRKHKQDVMLQQLDQKRLADAISDVYAQVAVLSRVGRSSRTTGVEPSGQERYIADTFCTRAADRVRGHLAPDRVERRRADDRDRQARLQARRLRLRPVRRLTSAAAARHGCSAALSVLAGVVDLRPAVPAEG